MRNTKLLKQTLPEPDRPDDLPNSVQWLAGEGAGSWFYIENTSKANEFLIQRFSPKGQLECEGVFTMENSKHDLNLSKAYRFVHLSHCAFVHIEQDGEVFRLVRKMHHGGTEYTEV
jgi:hypothetical protein